MAVQVAAPQDAVVLLLRVVRNIRPLPFLYITFRHSPRKKIMSSLDDLEVQRVKPFERLCFVMYVVLHMIFVFMALSFVKLLTDSGTTTPS